MAVDLELSQHNPVFDLTKGTLMTTLRNNGQRGLHLVASVCAALILAACGGGGGGSSTSTGGGTIGGNPSTTNGNLATSVPTPTYAAGSVELAMFNQLNDVRGKGGFGLLAQSSALDQATKNHANYLLQNFYASGIWNAAALGAIDSATNTMNAHVEKTGNPGYSGTLPQDRARAAGYASVSVGEVASEAYSLADSQLCMDRLLTSVFHRSIVLSTQLRDVGSAVQFSGTASACVINLGYLDGHVGGPPSGWVATYPYAGQVGLTTNMGLEAPDPVPSALIKGNPVSIYVEPQNTLTVSSFTLTDNSGNLVPVKLLTKTDFPQYITSAMAYIVPTQALASGMTYTVQFVGTNNGAALSRTWSFTTK